MTKQHHTIFVALVSLAAVSCRRGPGQDAPRPKPVASASPSAPLPADHLIPDELPEGVADAFGLKLPRAFKIVRSFDDAIFADGPGQPEPVANYVRRRVEAANVEIGPSGTIFVGARVRDRPSRTLRIDVTTRNGGTEIVLRDVTPPPIVPDLSEEERWRRNGLRPDGKPLDPTKLQ